MSAREVGVMYPARRFSLRLVPFELPTPAWFPADAELDRSYDDPARMCRVHVYRSPSFPARSECEPVEVVPYDCPSAPWSWRARPASGWASIDENQEMGRAWKAPAFVVRLAKAEAALRRIRDINPMLHAAKGETLEAWRDIAAAFDKIARDYFDEVER